jgi:hypothetical protein
MAVKKLAPNSGLAKKEHAPSAWSGFIFLRISFLVFDKTTIKHLLL